MFKEYTKIASEELRKIVTGLIIATFGMSFEKDGFKISEHLFLKYALILFFGFVLLDIFQYVFGAYKAKKQVKASALVVDQSITIFITKIFVAFVGLILCMVHIYNL